MSAKNRDRRFSAEIEEPLDEALGLARALVCIAGDMSEDDYRKSAIDAVANRCVQNLEVIEEKRMAVQDIIVSESRAKGGAA